MGCSTRICFFTNTFWAWSYQIKAFLVKINSLYNWEYHFSVKYYEFMYVFLVLAVL